MSRPRTASSHRSAVVLLMSYVGIEDSNYLLLASAAAAASLVNTCMQRSSPAGIGGLPWLEPEAASAAEVCLGTEDWLLTAGSAMLLLPLLSGT